MWCGQPLEGRKMPLNELHLITHVAKYTLVVIHVRPENMCACNEGLSLRGV